MQGILNAPEIRYVLFHLFQHFDIDTSYRLQMHEQSRLLVLHCDSLRVEFPLSAQALDVEQIRWLDSIPVLFPLAHEAKFYSTDGKNLRFSHDLLKSAFYLLSGLQEYNAPYHDHYDRFPFENSIQKKLGIIHKPVVNYYFEIITSALEQFCRDKGIPFRRKSLSEQFVFMLTHDIDLINAYDCNETGFKIKQFLGLAKRPYSKWKGFKVMLKHIGGFLFFPVVGNPYWTFPFLHKIATRYNLKATYFFLEKDGRHSDSYYKFNDRRILRIMRKLNSKGYEIALLGTRRSANDENAFLTTYTNLQNVYPEPIDGVRQHTLRYFAPYTARFWQKAGIKYDTTLGFAAHEGFRNSYCYPFKLYDFEKEEMIDVWEFPLNVMDLTLFDYRNLSFYQAHQNVKQLVQEVRKFGGLFTILWHNHYFDEERFPSIRQFYRNLMEMITRHQPEPLTGKETLERLNNCTYPHVEVLND